MEISPIYHNSRPEGKLPAQEAAAFDFLDALGIDYERVTHELADTMEKCDDVSPCSAWTCARTSSSATGRRRISTFYVCRRTRRFIRRT